MRKRGKEKKGERKRKRKKKELGVNVSPLTATFGADLAAFPPSSSKKGRITLSRRSNWELIAMIFFLFLSFSFFFFLFFCFSFFFFRCFFLFLFFFPYFSPPPFNYSLKKKVFVFCFCLLFVFSISSSTSPNQKQKMYEFLTQTKNHRLIYGKTNINIILRLCKNSKNPTGLGKLGKLPVFHFDATKSSVSRSF